MAFNEALQRGYLDPVRGTFHDAASQKTMKLDDAVIKGFLVPVLPSAAGDDPRYSEYAAAAAAAVVVVVVVVAAAAFRDGTKILSNFAFNAVERPQEKIYFVGIGEQLVENQVSMLRVAGKEYVPTPEDLERRQRMRTEGVVLMGASGPSNG